MEGIVIAFFVGMLVQWLLAHNQRRVLRRYRQREQWLSGMVRSVE
jgi:hypothetical protein